VNKNTSFDEQTFNFSTRVSRVLKLCWLRTAAKPLPDLSRQQTLEKSSFFRPAKPPFPANRYQTATSRAHEPLRIGLFLRR